MQKYRFYDVFEENTDGSLTPKIKINVNGVNFGPGVRFTKGVAFGGIDFYQYKGFDIAGEYINDIFFIKGFFQNNG